MTASLISFGRRSVILMVIFSAAAMFVTSFVYRMNHPNLFVQVEHQHEKTAPPQGMGEGGGPMAKVKEYMARVDQNPDDVEALTGLGNAFLMMRAWDRALIPLSRAAELAPQNTEVLKAVGIAYFNKAEYDKASDAYLAILKVDANDTLAFFNLGIINKYYFKKMDVARTYFEKVLSLEKNDSEMLKMAKQELEQ